MTERTDLKTIAAEWLADGKADVLIGWQAGTLPLAAAPLILHADRSGADPAGGNKDKLVFDARCAMNLVNLLHKFKDKKVAVVVKGCDSRSLIGLIQEKQVDRDRIVVIGAPCAGVIDPSALARITGCDAPSGATLEKDQVRVVCDREEKVVPLSEAVYPGCRGCSVRNPLLADCLIADPVEQSAAPEAFGDVEALRQMSRDERWRKFLHEMKRCILCHACRAMCPACYCRECFADITRPRLAGRTADPADAMFFHLLRLMHLAGRCTGCGACVRACPMGVDLRLYNDFLRAFAKKEYGFEAGADAQAPPFIGEFDQNDPNDFTM